MDCTNKIVLPCLVGDLVDPMQTTKSQSWFDICIIIESLRSLWSCVFDLKEIKVLFCCIPEFSIHRDGIYLYLIYNCQVSSFLEINEVDVIMDTTMCAVNMIIRQASS